MIESQVGQLDGTSSDLVIIRTFEKSQDGELSVALLRAAGVYSLLISQPPSGGPGGECVGLAVHARDVERADAVLSLAQG